MGEAAGAGCEGGRVRCVLLVEPYGAEFAGGNTVAAARIADGLTAAGLRVVRAAARTTTMSRLVAVARAEPIDVVHALHAFRAGPLASEVARRIGRPLVVSFRGTDAAVGLEHDCLRPLVALSVGRSAVVTTLTGDQRERVIGAFPAAAPRVVVVPPAVIVDGARDAAVRATLGVAPSAPLVVHAAGIREEKGFPEAWEIADAAHAALPDLRYVHAGPLLDPALGAAAHAWFAARPWAIRLGAAPRELVLDITAAATCSLHASTVEGLSNALLESMALGTPAVAREIPASRAAIDDGVTGILFRDVAGAVRGIVRCHADAAAARALGDAARSIAAARFSPAAETSGYRDVYERAARRPDTQ